MSIFTARRIHSQTQRAVLIGIDSSSVCLSVPLRYWVLCQNGWTDRRNSFTAGWPAIL